LNCKDPSHTITANYFRGAAGVICIYDCTDRKCNMFDSLPRWLADPQQVPLLWVLFFFCLATDTSDSCLFEVSVCDMFS
jgi:hypothetical protein